MSHVEGVIALLKLLHSYYIRRELPHFFLDDVNLLEEYGDVDIDEVARDVAGMISDIDITINSTLDSVQVVDYRLDLIYRTSVIFTCHTYVHQR